MVTTTDGGDWSPPGRVPTDLAPLLPRLIADYEAALQPADPRDAAVVLGRLAAHFWTPDRPPEHHRILYEDLFHDLAEYPLGVIAEVADAWRQTQRWAPKICELRERCDALLHRWRGEFARLRFLAQCVDRHGGECPRLLRRIGDNLVDYRDGMTAWMVEAALAGETKFHGDLVLAVPGAALPSNAPDPAIVAYRDRVRTILADAGFSAMERQRLGDITEERAEALAAERVKARAESDRRQRVLRILIDHLPVAEIEARAMLDLPEDEARAIAEERLRRTAAIAEAAAAEPATETVQ